MVEYDWAIYVEDKKFELEIGQYCLYKGLQEH